MYNVSQENRKPLVSCLLRTEVGYLPGPGTMAPDILLIWSNVSPKQTDSLDSVTVVHSLVRRDALVGPIPLQEESSPARSWHGGK